MTGGDARRTEEESVLLAPDPGLGVPIPAYGGRSLPNLMSSLADHLGRPKEGTTAFLAPLAPNLDPFQGKPPDGPVVVLLLDGLGWLALRDSAARDLGGTAARWLPRARPITSVFPTTTTIALTSLSTAAAPAQHGVVGHRVYLPRYGAVVELLRMSPLGVPAPETLVGPDWSPSLVSGVPSVFRRGVTGAAISKDRFQGSGFTRLLYDGAEFVGYSAGSDLAITLTEVLSRPEPPSLILAYRDELDVVQHGRSPRPELVDLELERVGSILSFVRRHLEPRRCRSTTFVVTGDHGQVPLRADHQLLAHEEPELLGHLARPPSGDRRATYFAARPGQLTALRDALAVRAPPGSILLEIPRALEAGLFGPPPFHPEISERLGDLVLLMPSPGGVVYSVPGARTPPHPMLGAHGGLEPEELLVPLVSGPLADLAPDPRRTPHLRGRNPAVREE